MNSSVQSKINEIKKLSTHSKLGNIAANGMNKKHTDGLSMAIHSPKDAETFLMELKAIRKQNK